MPYLSTEAMKSLLLFVTCLAATAVMGVEEALVPHIRGPWTTIAHDPDLGGLSSEHQQPVDFGIWRAADNTWQLWSCVRHTKESGRTRLFHRWESGSLTAPDWKPMGIAMRADSTLGETPGGLQAPFVFRDGGKFRMLYGDWVRICSATSEEGKSFRRDVHTNGQPALFAEGHEENARDPFVMKIGDRWYCYYTATRTTERSENDKPITRKIGVVYVRTSPDLATWSEAQVVASGGEAGDGLFSAECPHVVEVTPGHFYLFRTQRYGWGAQTRVYHSTDPMDFGHGPSDEGDARHLVSSLPMAAPEIVKMDGQWFVAALREDLKGIQVAGLEWLPMSEVPSGPDAKLKD